MDTSKKYILMCEKAKEIQETWCPKEGDHRDLVWSNWDGLSGKYKGKGRVWIANLNTWKEFRHSNNGVEWFKKFCTWLPRQDQLQEMLSETHMLCAKISMFHDFYDPERSCPEIDPCKKCQKIGKYRRSTFRTMEQLWLGFVMSELYKKRWDDKKKDWVKP